MSFKYQLEQSKAENYAGGTNKTATQENIPALTGIAMYSMEIYPGCLRELHWHPNASELNYCLSGQGQIVILSPENNGAFYSYPIKPGSVTFIPTGYAHCIFNTSTTDTLHMIPVFSNEEPEHIDISNTLGNISTTLWNQTFSINSFPSLPVQEDQFLVVNQGSTLSDLQNAAPADLGPFSANIFTNATTYKGGTVWKLTTSQIPELSGLTLFYLQENPGALREPHWHPNAGEMDYCINGSAEMTIQGPNGEIESFPVTQGDVVFIPQNYLHYIANTEGANALEFLVFFTNEAPTDIDFSQVFTTFQVNSVRNLLAASFGQPASAFASVPAPGDVFLAPPNPAGA